MMVIDGVVNARVDGVGEWLYGDRDDDCSAGGWRETV